MKEANGEGWEGKMLRREKSGNASTGCRVEYANQQWQRGSWGKMGEGEEAGMKSKRRFCVHWIRQPPLRSQRTMILYSALLLGPNARGDHRRSWEPQALRPGTTALGTVETPSCPTSSPSSSPSTSSPTVRYWLGAGSKTWEDAEAACAASGGHLASVSGAAQNAEVQALCGSAPYCWIGGTKVGIEASMRADGTPAMVDRLFPGIRPGSGLKLYAQGQIRLNP